MVNTEAETVVWVVGYCGVAHSVVMILDTTVWPEDTGLRGCVSYTRCCLECED